MNLVQRVKGKLNPYKPSKIYQRLDERKSLSKFGHGAGYSHHLQGERDIQNALKWGGVESAAARQMREEGFALIEPYAPEVMAEIRTEWDKIIEDDEKAPWSGPASRQIRQPQINLPSAKKLLTDEVLNHFRAYYGTEVRIMAMLCWRNYDPRDKRGEHVFSNWWHFDATNTAISKLFVAVSDFEDDSGPFHIYPISRTKELVKMGYVDRRNYGHAPVDHYEGMYKMTGPSGTAVIANTELCLHKAGEPTNGNTRDIIQFQIVPSSRPFDEHWADHLMAKGVDRK